MLFAAIALCIALVLAVLVIWHEVTDSLSGKNK
jgi:hypothetical protein